MVNGLYSLAYFTSQLQINLREQPGQSQCLVTPAQPYGQQGRGACGIIAAIMLQGLSEMQIGFGCHLVKVARRAIMNAVIIQIEP